MISFTIPAVLLSSQHRKPHNEMAAYLITWVTVNDAREFEAGQATFDTLTQMADFYAKISKHINSFTIDSEYLPMPQVFIIDGEYRELSELEYDMIEPGKDYFRYSGELTV